MRVLDGTLACLVYGLSVLPAQEGGSRSLGPLFRHRGDLVAAGPAACSLDAALRRVISGPSPSEQKRGWTTAVPAGTQLLRWQHHSTHTELVLGGNFAAAVRDGTALEDALEQIQKTAVRHGARSVTITLRDEAGTEHDLSDYLARHRPVIQGTRPPLGSTPGNDGPAIPGALAGRTIVISPGHGYYWHSSLGWTTQRPLIDGLLEDIHVNEIAMRYIIPTLENLGARVLSCRDRGEGTFEAFGDNDQGAPGYTETGGWSTSASSGWQGGSYRFANTTATETAVARWEVPVTTSGLHPVHVFYRGSSNRTTDARYRVVHAGGVAECRVDQTQDDRRFVHLGDYWFDAGTDAVVELSNASAQIGVVVIADAVRVGAGLGSIDRGAGTSGRPRWQEAARYWTQYDGAPSSVYNSVSGGQDNDDDVTTRPRYAEWRGADAFVSLHTNAGGGEGTSSFIYSGGATAGSSNLQNTVHDQLVGDIRALYDPTWVDRGKRSANFGELRVLSSMPGVLLEAAFHDTAGSRDHDALHDPVFRRIVGEAIAKGVLRHFQPSAPLPLQPPAAPRVQQDGGGGLRASWESVSGALYYTVESSPNGKNFESSPPVFGTSWSTGPLQHHSMVSFRVRAWNSSGRSFPTEVLTAGTNHQGTAEVLLVQGFDRLSRSVKGPENTRDYLRLHGDAIRRDAVASLGFDACSNEALLLGRVNPNGYGAIDWLLGEESTADETFSAAEQSLVQGYLQLGGRLLVTGAEIGWDLDNRGSAADRTFFRSVLGATYVADDADTYAFALTATGLGAGLGSGSFDNGTGLTYDVDWPDVLTPSDALSQPFATYLGGTGGTAGIQRVSGNSRVVLLGFPLESIVDPGLRADVMGRALDFLLDRELTAPESIALGTAATLELSLPAEATQSYLIATGTAIQPPITLSNSDVFPIANGPFLDAGFTPNPFLQGFAGLLNGAGAATATVTIPALPGLHGLEFYFCALTADVPFAPRRITNWRRVRLQ